MSDKSRNEECACGSGWTRRGFIASMGAGAAALAVSGRIASAALEKGEEVASGEVSKITLNINGRRHRLLVEPRWSLLFVLRDVLKLTGTKVGCERGECGACTVLIDNRPQYACMMLAVEAQRAEIVTVEGLMEGENLGVVQQAFVEEDAYQCGYCTPGQIMAVEGLLRENSAPSLEEVRVGVSGNLCRCGAYVNIFRAAEKAARRKGGKGERP